MLLLSSGAKAMTENNVIVLSGCFVEDPIYGGPGIFRRIMESGRTFTIIKNIGQLIETDNLSDGQKIRNTYNIKNILNDYIEAEGNDIINKSFNNIQVRVWVDQKSINVNYFHSVENAKNKTPDSKYLIKCSSKK